MSQPAKFFIFSTNVDEIFSIQYLSTIIVTNGQSEVFAEHCAQLNERETLNIYLEV